MSSEYKLESYNFNLPDSLIANSPVEPRDSSKLLIYNNNAIIDSVFYNIANFLPKNAVFILNDTKVIKARLRFKIKDREVELFFVEKISDSDYKVLVRPGKVFKINFEFFIPGGFSCRVVNIDEDGFRIIRIEINLPLFDLNKYLSKYGEIPLPPYIKTDSPSDFNEKYQTVYANQYGSIAAPTAGLHFTSELIEALKSDGFKFEYVTLDVGIGTFMPVKVDNILDHKMHSEMYTMTENTANNLNKYKKEGRFFVCVGTTTLRVLESSFSYEKKLFMPNSKTTDIFIYPGYKNFVVDALLTNFHLPKSTLFMLVSAIVGLDKAKDIYNHAIKNNYRFYSFGDSSLIYF
jgi:S-adenosylmethionine:tRNA ribosyltransferase-isomerase